MGQTFYEKRKTHFIADCDPKDRFISKCSYRKGIRIFN